MVTAGSLSTETIRRNIMECQGKYGRPGRFHPAPSIGAELPAPFVDAFPESVTAATFDPLVLSTV